MLQFETKDSLIWSSVSNADGYDIIRGDLEWLHALDGAFIGAVRECLAHDLAENSLGLTLDPLSGEGFWYLGRSVTSDLHGSYDSGGAMQLGSRDEEVSASGSDCP
jgi:hypothetical protein